MVIAALILAAGWWWSQWELDRSQALTETASEAETVIKKAPVSGTAAGKHEAAIAADSAQTDKAPEVQIEPGRQPDP